MTGHQQQVLSQLLHASQATLDVVHIGHNQPAQPADGTVLQTLRATGSANVFTET